MTRRTVIGVVIALLAVVLLAALVVGFASSHVTSTVVIPQLKAGALPSPRVRVMPGGFVLPFGQQVGRRVTVGAGGGAIGGLGLALALLLAGGIGALIATLVGATRPAAAASAPPVPPPGVTSPYDAQYQQFAYWQQWQQFEQWHRQMHAAAAPEAATAPLTPPPDAAQPGEPTSSDASAEPQA
jgi:hypothetical protein